MLVVYLIFVIAFLRLCAWLRLNSLLRRIDGLIAECEQITDKYGRTAGELADAGQTENLNRLQSRAGRLYTYAVPYAAFLLWWPVGPLLMDMRIRKAVAESGKVFGPNQMGAIHVARDLQWGITQFTNYYYSGLLKGNVGALRLAKLLF